MYKKWFFILISFLSISLLQATDTTTFSGQVKAVLWQTISENKVKIIVGTGIGIYALRTYLKNSWQKQAQQDFFNAVSDRSSYKWIQCVKDGADVNACDDMLHETVLIKAVKSNNATMVDWLLKGNADGIHFTVNIQNIDAALLVAQRKQKTEFTAHENDDDSDDDFDCRVDSGEKAANQRIIDVLAQVSRSKNPIDQIV